MASCIIHVADIIFLFFYNKDSTRSERLIIDKLFKQDSSIRQSQIIVDWLEKNMQDKVEDQLQTDNLKFHSESVYWYCALSKSINLSQV